MRLSLCKYIDLYLIYLQIKPFYVKLKKDTKIMGY